MIPLTNLAPAIEAARPGYERRLAAMFARGQFILGPQLAEFENAFAAATGAKHAVGVGTGTAAIELCLRAAGITGEVLTSPLTAPFTGVAIAAAGAKPRFADIDPETLLIQPDDYVTRRTAAIVPVHLYGQPCAVDRFRGFGVPVIQDACQAHGARLHDRALTRYSPYVTYSFYPTKNLGALGDGGAVATDSKRIADHIRRLRDGGRRGYHVSVEPAINSRLDEMQACYLAASLPYLEARNRERARIAAFYDEALRGCGGVRPVQRGAESVNHLYVIRAERRDKLRDFLTARGIGTGIHYLVPLHKQAAFLQRGLRLPHAERAVREILSLPLWPGLPQSGAEHVVDAVRAFYATGAPSRSRRSVTGLPASLSTRTAR